MCDTTWWLWTSCRPQPSGPPSSAWPASLRAVGLVTPDPTRLPGCMRAAAHALKLKHPSKERTLQYQISVCTATLCISTR